MSESFTPKTMEEAVADKTFLSVEWHKLGFFEILVLCWKSETHGVVAQISELGKRGHIFASDSTDYPLDIKKCERTAVKNVLTIYEQWVFDTITALEAKQ